MNDSPNIQRLSVLVLYCITKYSNGHPLSGQTCSLNKTDVEFGWINAVPWGTPGASPWVRIDSVGDWSDFPILFWAIKNKWYVLPQDKFWKVKNKLRFWEDQKKRNEIKLLLLIHMKWYVVAEGALLGRNDPF